jgi:hypothetical protein
MTKKRIYFVTVVAIILLSWFSTTDILAESKKQLAQLVMEHEVRITSLEELIKNLDTRPENETLEPETKQALTKEINTIVGYGWSQWDGEKTVELNITDHELIFVDGGIIVKVFTEGNHDWTDTLDGYGNTGVGRSFARNFVPMVDVVAKMYGVNAIFEFYENGERIKSFTNIE